MTMEGRSRVSPSALLVTALTLLGLSSLTGCEGMGQVKVVIPDYASAKVRGITLWQLDAATGEFAPRTVYHLGEIIEQGGVEYVRYSVDDDRFELDVPLAAPVTRDPARPEALTLDLTVLTMGEAITVRASTFNEAGESGLSQAASIAL